MDTEFKLNVLESIIFRTENWFSICVVFCCFYHRLFEIFVNENATYCNEISCKYIAIAQFCYYRTSVKHCHQSFNDSHLQLHGFRLFICLSVYPFDIKKSYFLPSLAALFRFSPNDFACSVDSVLAVKRLGIKTWKKLTLLDILVINNKNASLITILKPYEALLACTVLSVIHFSHFLQTQVLKYSWMLWITDILHAAVNCRLNLWNFN